MSGLGEPPRRWEGGGGGLGRTANAASKPPTTRCDSWARLATADSRGAGGLAERVRGLWLRRGGRGSSSGCCCPGVGTVGG